MGVCVCVCRLHVKRINSKEKNKTKKKPISGPSVLVPSRSIGTTVVVAPVRPVTLRDVLSTFDTYNIFMGHLMKEFSIEACCMFHCVACVYVCLCVYQCFHMYVYIVLYTYVWYVCMYGKL